MNFPRSLPRPENFRSRRHRNNRGPHFVRQRAEAAAESGKTNFLKYEVIRELVEVDSKHASSALADQLKPTFHRIFGIDRLSCFFYLAIIRSQFWLTLLNYRNVAL